MAAGADAEPPGAAAWESTPRPAAPTRRGPSTTSKASRAKPIFEKLKLFFLCLVIDPESQFKIDSLVFCRTRDDLCIFGNKLAWCNFFLHPFPSRVQLTSGSRFSVLVAQYWTWQPSLPLFNETQHNDESSSSWIVSSCPLGIPSSAVKGRNVDTCSLYELRFSALSRWKCVNHICQRLCVYVQAVLFLNLQIWIHSDKHRVRK